MRLNLGSGRKRYDGFLNVDNWAEVEPDVLHDLEKFPWPFEDESVDEICMEHILEHLGRDPNVFFRIMQELYRVMKPGATLRVVVPHPRHDDFIASPDHVRPILPQTMLLFSKEQMQKCIDNDDATTPFAFMYDVDFRLVKVNLGIADWVSAMREAGHLPDDMFAQMINTMSNTVAVIDMTLERI